jgi:hypothetical protein
MSQLTQIKEEDSYQFLTVIFPTEIKHMKRIILEHTKTILYNVDYVDTEPTSLIRFL